MEKQKIGLLQGVPDFWGVVVLHSVDSNHASVYAKVCKIQ